MKVQNYTYPDSSFLSVEKDMSIIVDYLCKNERLKKLLYYTSKDCLLKPNLTEDQSLEIFGKNIKIIPKLYADNSVLNYIIVNFDNFIQSGNPQFRDNVIEFDIICHFDQWQLEDFQLRPYRIAAEIDTILNHKRLTGIGKVEFLGASQLVINNEYAGLCLMYQTIHGEEDKNPLMKDSEQISMEDNFNSIFNE